MTSTGVGATPAHLRIARISGLIIELTEPLERQLSFKLCIDDQQIKVPRKLGRSKDLVNKPQHLRLDSFLDLSHGSTLAVQIQEEHNIRKWREKQTEFKIPFERIWQHLEQSQITEKFVVDDGPKKTISLDVKIHPSSSTVSSNTGIHASTADASSSSSAGQEMKSVEAPEAAIEAALAKLQEGKSSLERLGRMKDAWEMGLKIGTAVSGINSTAKIVLSCVNIIYDQFKLQDEARKQIQGLAEAMSPIAADIEQIKEVTKSDKLGETMDKFTSLMKETIELIEKMVEQKGIKNAISKFLQATSTKDTIDGLKQRLDTFSREFHQRISIEALGVIKNVAKVQETEKDDAALKKLEDRLLKGVEFNSRAVECMKGTGGDIKDDVRKAIEEGKNVVWITGFPGVGKSALASSIASDLVTQQQPTFYFRFDRAKPGVNTNALWRLIAYKLASRYSSVRKSILEWLQNEDVDLTSPNIDSLFTGLITAPFSKLASDSTSLPSDHCIIIVIDALDECGGLDGLRSRDRKNLLLTLAHWPQLDDRFKLVVTSREEGDITRTLTSISTHISILSGGLLETDSQARERAFKDVQAFFVERFSNITASFPESLPSNWPGNEDVGVLTRRAAGVFQWAVTVANFLDSAPNPKARLEQIMRETPESSGMQELYLLYSNILRTLCKDVKGDEMKDLVSILGTMVFAKRPLNNADYVGLLGIDQSTVEFIRNGLRSVIEPGDTLHFTHQSFTDYLLSDQCLSEFTIKEDYQQQILAESCLRTMFKELRFNICNLETSGLKNADVPDIEAKVKNCLPTCLSYSCCFFADHLSCTPFNESLMSLLKDVSYGKLLYLMEALSLLKEINRLPPLLREVLRWSNTARDEELDKFIQDALRFIQSFARPIAQSAPHIYISALPFAPEHSAVARHFLPEFSNTISFVFGKPSHWPPCLFITEQPTTHRTVMALAFSPVQRSFVCGTDEGTIFICDAETGNLIAGPFYPSGSGEAPFVECVEFLPGGQYVLAGYRDGAVRVWDVETGNEFVCRESLSYATVVSGYRIWHCACYRDGIVVVSTKDDISLAIEMLSSALLNKTVALIFGNCIKHLILPDLDPPILDLCSHSIFYRLAYSIGGQYLAMHICSGSSESVVIVYNMADQTFREEWHFSHNNEWITALSFSPDSRSLAICFQGGSLLVQSVETGKCIGRPTTHTWRSPFTSVAYSPDGRLLIAAAGTTLVAWDAFTYNEVIDPLHGHSGEIRRICVSPNNKKILSTSDDSTLRMWDLDPSIAPHSAISQVSHPDPVTSFAFSPCGKKLASLLVTRNAIYVWDTPNFTIDLSTTIDFHYLNLLAYSPDGRYILCVRHQGTNLQIWDAETGKPSTVYPLAPAMYHNPPIQKIFFVPSDNRWLLVVHVGGTRLKIWDDDGSKPEIQVELPLNFDNRFPHDGRGVTPFHGVQAFSPDISRAFVVIPDPSASSSVRLEVWFTDTMERPPIQLHDAPKEIDLVEFQGSFSPCGRLVEVHNVRGGIYIWDAETGALVSRPIRVLHTPGAPRTWVTVVFSPDSNFIASAPFWSSTMDKAIHIWNVRTGDRVRGPWDVHKDAVTHLAFSPDGSTLVSSSKDGTIGFWDASDLHERVQGSKPTGGLPDAFSIEDGWAMGESGELLFWIPPELRTGMWRPKNTKVISPGPTAKLDYTRFKYGRGWAECRNGQQSDRHFRN